jgi:hypothetical protein
MPAFISVVALDKSTDNAVIASRAATWQSLPKDALIVTDCSVVALNKSRRDDMSVEKMVAVNKIP